MLTGIALAALAVNQLGDNFNKDMSARSLEPTASRPKYIESDDQRVVGNVVPRPFGDDAETTSQVHSSIASKPHPAALYEKYLGLAEDGDVDAAYVLVTALRQCRGAPVTERELQEKIASIGLPEDIVEFETRRFSGCKPLYDRLPDIDVEHDRWFKVVLDAQHPLVQVMQRNSSYDEMRAAIRFAIAGNYPEPHMYDEVFLAASRLSIEFPEKGQSEIHFYAWQLLSCSYGLNCNLNQMFEEMRSQLPANQVAEILSTKTTLEKAIERRDWEALGI